jgi:SM-20-related protein
MMLHELLAEQMLADETILSASEKQLLSSLVQHCKDASRLDDAVAAAIARAVGEVVSSRSNQILGERIVDRLSGRRPAARLGTPPVPSPGPGPRPPGPNPPGPGISDRPNRAWLGSTPPVPSPEPGPRPPGPNPPGPGISDLPETTSEISVVESICGFSQTALTANYVLFDEFLAPAELLSLANYVLQHEREFQISEVVSPGVRGGIVETETRRSRVLMDLGRHRDLIISKLTAALPDALRRLGHPQFEISRVEAQITASNHGDFFHWHSDNGLDAIAGREITFVYFFHREPKPFTGGELRIYDSRWEQNHYVPAGGYRAIVPEQNQLVVFHSSLTHEITQVQSPSQLFTDSRFTVNGWFHK